jgi:hypothetical protein
MAWLEGTEYFWVVLCKNRGFHNKYNLFSRHAIPLAETDEVSPPPQVEVFAVRCDDCGEEYTYKANEVLRAELERPESFTPHPLFEGSASGQEARPRPVPNTSTAKMTVLEHIRAAVRPYLRLRRKEGSPPPWRR